jgi:hypothetical protein
MRQKGEVLRLVVDRATSASLPPAKGEEPPMACQSGQRLVPALTFWIIAFLASTGLFEAYGNKDNPRWIEPEDVEVHWLSGEEQRAFLASSEVRTTTPDGASRVLAVDPGGERASVLRQFQLETPDGKWRGRITVRSGTHALRRWLGSAFPVLAFSSLALILSLKGCKGPKKPVPAAEFE